MEIPDGTVADCNYVWLSDWELENINGNYLLPIDFDAYLPARHRVASPTMPSGRSSPNARPSSRGLPPFDLVRENPHFTPACPSRPSVAPRPRVEFVAVDRHHLVLSAQGNHLRNMVTKLMVPI